MTTLFKVVISTNEGLLAAKVGNITRVQEIGSKGLRKIAHDLKKKLEKADHTVGDWELMTNSDAKAAGATDITEILG